MVSVTTSQSKSIGAEYVLAEQMNRYGFDAILQRLGFSAKQINYAKELINLGEHSKRKTIVIDAGIPLKTKACYRSRIPMRLLCGSFYLDGRFPLR